MCAINSTYHQTRRLKIHALEGELRQNRQTIVFLHGNASSSVFWKQIMELIPDTYNVLAPDLRGYGKTEDKLIDATLGFSDQAEDVISMMDELDITAFHVAGHSMGGGVIYDLLVNHPERLLTATLVNPVSPFGFGGTKDEKGTPIWDDYAGTGAGTANPEFARRIQENDRSEVDPNASPRVVMNTFYWKPPFKADNEEELLEGLLDQKIGVKRYPGDKTESENWPYFAPGRFGPVNAASPKYLQVLASKLINTSPKPDILWVRGKDDKIVSDESMFDSGVLGRMGLIPAFPGSEIYPVQPMVSRTRFVLQQYEIMGGTVTEKVMIDTGHTPFIEKPEEFLATFLTHMER